MRIGLKLPQKALLMVKVPLAFQLLVTAGLLTRLHQAELEVKRAEHAKVVAEQINELMEDLVAITRAVAVYAFLGGTTDTLSRTGSPPGVFPQSSSS